MCGEVKLPLVLTCALLVCLLHMPAALASDPVPLASRFTRLDIQDGLSQATVTALTQDHLGNMWIGTQNGLNRFDGFNLKVFLPEEKQPHSLSDNFVTSLTTAADGTIWIGTLRGLSRYVPKRASFDRITSTNVLIKDNNAILSLHLDANNRLWVGTEQGLAYWDPATDSLQRWPAESGDAPEYQQQNITAITSDSHDNLWLGTPRGVICVNKTSGALADLSDFPVQHASVLALLHDSSDGLWVGLENDGLWVKSNNSQSWTNVPLPAYDNGITSKEIRSILMDHQGDVWVGTQHGLHQLTVQNGRWQSRSAYFHQRYNNASLGSGKVVSVFESRDHSIWAGTWNGGVSRINQANNLFASITTDLSLFADARNPATITLTTDSNNLLVGTADGLFQLDATSARMTAIGDPKASLTFYSSLRLPHQLLFGHRSGIKMLNTDNGDYQDVVLPADTPVGPVRRMLATPDRLWLAIEQYGIVVVDRALQQIIAQQPFSRSITFIQQINQQYVAVGSYNGLSWFDANSGKLVFNHLLGQPASNTTFSLPTAPMGYAQTNDGRRWLATNGNGLFELTFDSNTIKPESARLVQRAGAESLASTQLKSIEPDNAGNLWLSSAVGISVYSPAANSTRNFGALHGTLSRDYINASSAQFANGTIIFGGMNGFTLFQPDKVLAYQPHAIATPQITDIKTNGSALILDSLTNDASVAKILYDKHQLSVPASRTRSVNIEYSTREFIEPQHIQFQYRLDPLTSDWIAGNVNNRIATFERLPPGNYQFRLRANLPGAEWTDEYQLDIEVQPLWWETWTARLLLLVLAISALVAVHLLRLRQLHKRQEELAWLVEERTDALNERTKALQDSKNRAEQTLEQLASTMKELVRTEKMAALGQLVAGVAHEVNTPLGVALTASSIVNEESHKLSNKLAGGNIRRQELDLYLSTLTQATQLLITNLQRAAQLVMNFKQVSVDRTSDNQRIFNLAEYLAELLESLSLMWRRKKVDIRVECPEYLSMDSYPGTIGQIITNFTQNALMHAFEEGQPGQIIIRCRKLENNVEITFADNGKGISADHIERIFDPFFTTNRQRGGTGLGLHIVYNLVTQKLCGHISVSSSPTTGTSFTLLLPLKV